MQIAKWGNSLAIDLPAAVVEAFDLKEGDDIEIHLAPADSIGIARKPDRGPPEAASYLPRQPTRRL